MAGKLVPIEDLPDEVRAQIKPGTDAFKAYAKHYEREFRLEPGTLTNAKFDFRNSDALMALPSIAQDARNSSGGPKPAGKPEKVRVPSLEELRSQMLDEYNPAQRFLIGMGSSVDQLRRGVGQMLGVVPQSEIDEAAAIDRPLLKTTAGMLGNIGGTMALSAIPAAGAAKVVANPYAATALSGAAYSGASPVESGSSRAGQAALGGALNVLGQGLGEGVAALTRPATTYAKDSIKQLAQRAKEFGIPLRAADVSPSPTLKTIQAASDMLPLSGGPAQREAAGTAFNKRLAKTMGEDTDDLLLALRNARARNSALYDSLNARNVAELDPVKHGQKMIDALHQFELRDTSKNKEMTEQLRTYLNNLLDPAKQHGVINPKTGAFEMPGDKYKDLRSEAGQLAKRFKSGTDPQGDRLHDFFKSVQGYLDDGMRNSSSMTAADRAAYLKADKEWANMRALEDIAPKDATGDLDFTRLASVLNSRAGRNVYGRQNMLYGTGDQTLPDLARIGTTFLHRGEKPNWARSVGSKAAELAPKFAAPAAIGGLYALNASHDQSGADALNDTLLEALTLGAGSMALGKGLNSRWFLEGAPKADMARRALGAVGFPARAPLAAYLENLRQAPVGPQEPTGEEGE